MKTFLNFLFLGALGVIAFSGAAMAGYPTEWGLGLQDPASTTAYEMEEFHNLLFIIITGITLFVLALLVFVIVRYNKHLNPEPAKFSHNTTIEVIWTVVPVLILLVILFPSLRLIYYSDRTLEPELTIKVTGYQWYWGYEYPEYEGLEFLSYMVPDDEIGLGQKRLLSTDNVVVLPVDTNIQILVTAADVLHSWAVPSLGLKKDAVPGRLNETWVRITKPGTYYGQCSELCGKDHAYMPIEIRAVPKDVFERWARAGGGTPEDYM